VALFFSGTFDVIEVENGQDLEIYQAQQTLEGVHREVDDDEGEVVFDSGEKDQD